MNYKLQAINISKTYISKVEKVSAVNKVSINIELGKKIAIVGPSGCGKTTLINLLGLLIKPTYGEIMLNSVSTNSLNEKQLALCRNKEFGYIVQDFALIEHYTVFENIRIPLVYSEERIKKDVQRKKAEEILKKVDLLSKIDSKVSDLSGGQRQRVAIARAIINNPSIILADEPTGSLDSKSSINIFELLCKLTKENKALILVTHNLELAQKCDCIIKMKDGSIIM